jgi:penicillin-binding protein 1A
VFGPTRLRRGLIKSRNLVSIRLLRAIGISYAINYLERFGFRRESLPRDLSLSLGSASITPLELITGYATFANGGYKVEPYYIDRVETAESEVILRANPLVVCKECEQADSVEEPSQDTALMEAGAGDDGATDNTNPDSNVLPRNTDMLIPVNDPQMADAMMMPNGEVADHDEAMSDTTVASNDIASMDNPHRVAKRIVTAQNMYIMNSLLRDVVKRGTGRRALVLHRSDIAGKTGTTNEQQDAWFSGFNPKVVATAWVGFDEPHTLGHSEYGGRAALPMWIDYMREALKGMPEITLETPPGLVTVRIDPETGLLVGADFPNAIFEIFRADKVPKRLEDETTVSSGTEQGGDATTASEPENIPEQLF